MLTRGFVGIEFHGIFSTTLRSKIIMIVSWNWLSEYLRLEMSVDQLAEKLALSGLNHESTEDVGGDLAIDLEVTSNRPDCLNHLGIAREIGVLFEIPVKWHEPLPKSSETADSVFNVAKVENHEPLLCPNFTARVVTGATVKESPWWLRKRLETLGVRPISNIVDITNYVLFECGQPLHAYDLVKFESVNFNIQMTDIGAAPKLCRSPKALFCSVWRILRLPAVNTLRNISWSGNTS